MAQKKLESYIDEFILGNQQQQNSENQIDRSKYRVTLDEIKKLQIICDDGKAQDYFRKLVELYEQVKYKNTSDQVKDICYIQLGKKIINKIQNQPQYQPSFNNLYIRGQLMPNIVQHIKEKAKTSQNNIFILPNQNGINFSPNKSPHILKSHIETKNYIQIIKQVNYIIQNQIYKQKYGKTPHKDYWLIFLIGIIILTMLIIILNIVIFSQIIIIITSFFLVLTLIFILSYSLQIFRFQMKRTDIVLNIYQEIKKYFIFLNGISNNNLEWTIGQYFFWIQIKIHQQQKQKSQVSNFNIINYNGNYINDRIKQS